MKVAFHTDQLWFSAPGGIGTYVRELARALRAMNGGPELATFQVGAGDGTADEVVTGTIRSVYPRWDLTGRPALPFASDVVHATNHAAIPPAARGAGLVVTVHDLAFDVCPEAFPPMWRWLYRAGVRAAARRADLILVPSLATADDLEDRHGVGPERIRVTPLAASLPTTSLDVDEVLGRLGIARPYVLCPATLEPRKNQVRLIRAYRQTVPDVPHTLVLTGPQGWGADAIVAEIARTGPGTIVRTGLLAPEDLDAVLRGADAVAYVSTYEGFGLPVIEAMQRGVPVLGSTTAAVAETAGDAALLVNPVDVAAIAEGLARVLTDRMVHDDLMEKGRSRAAGYSWEATAHATLDAYRDAVASARA
ncbi:MAG: glycosyltransferase family 1 protein [Actinomycetota bacterium]